MQIVRSTPVLHSSTHSPHSIRLTLTSSNAPTTQLVLSQSHAIVPRTLIAVTSKQASAALSHNTQPSRIRIQRKHNKAATTGRTQPSGIRNHHPPDLSSNLSLFSAIFHSFCSPLFAVILLSFCSISIIYPPPLPLAQSRSMFPIPFPFSQIGIASSTEVVQTSLHNLVEAATQQLKRLASAATPRSSKRSSPSAATAA